MQCLKGDLGLLGPSLVGDQGSRHWMMPGCCNVEAEEVMTLKKWRHKGQSLPQGSLGLGSLPAMWPWEPSKKMEKVYGELRSKFHLSFLMNADLDRGRFAMKIRQQVPLKGSPEEMRRQPGGRAD